MHVRSICSSAARVWTALGRGAPTVARVWPTARVVYDSRPEDECSKLQLREDHCSPKSLPYIDGTELYFAREVFGTKA